MQAHQAELHKELGIVDVVLAQITHIVTLEFFGNVVKAGSSHAVLWLTAIALFFVPQALVVTYLNQLMRSRAACTSGHAWFLTMQLVFWWRGIYGSTLSSWSRSTVLFRSPI